MRSDLSVSYHSSCPRETAPFTPDSFFASRAEVAGSRYSRELAEVDAARRIRDVILAGDLPSNEMVLLYFKPEVGRQAIGCGYDEAIVEDAVLRRTRLGLQRTRDLVSVLECSKFLIYLRRHICTAGVNFKIRHPRNAGFPLGDLARLRLRSNPEAEVNRVVLALAACRGLSGIRAISVQVVVTLNHLAGAIRPAGQHEVIESRGLLLPARFRPITH